MSTHTGKDVLPATPLSQWIMRSEGIAWEVISTEIQRYLGSGATVIPQDEYGRPGYRITAYTALTPGNEVGKLYLKDMTFELKLNSWKWLREIQELGDSVYAWPRRAYMDKLGNAFISERSGSRWYCATMDISTSNTNLVPTFTRKVPAPVPLQEDRYWMDYGSDRIAHLKGSSADTPDHADEESLARGTEEELAGACAWEFGRPAFTDQSHTHLVVERFLGHGSLGVVEEVSTSTPGAYNFVRKRVQLPASSLIRKSRQKIIKNEVAIMRGLTHAHIVRIIGTCREESATGTSFFFIMMFPAGDRDLKTFLGFVTAGHWWHHDETRSPFLVVDGPLKYVNWLKKWFGCLASALAYMHEQGVRHQDIKPTNIVQRGANVLFTDFSSSHQFDLGSTTSTDNPARTSAMYAAPEALRNGDNLPRHGLGTDVFALGCVFIEMLSVIGGRSVEAMHSFLLQGKGDFSQGLLYSDVIDRVDAWFPSGFGYRMYRDCIRQMLASRREERPKAEKVTKDIWDKQPWKVLPCSCQLA